MQKIKKVALIGGTHGNELSGIYLLKKWKQKKQLSSWSTLDITTKISNPRACEQSVRYTETDLNREFGDDDLKDMNKTGYESLLAKKLNMEFGPKGQSNYDLIIDLHNTTSHMGACLMLLEKDMLNIQLGAYVKKNMPNANIYFQDNIEKKNRNFLISLAKNGITIEVGAQPNSVLQQETLELMETMTKHVLDFLLLYNESAELTLPKTYEAYQYQEDLFLPIDENGERNGMVVKSVDTRDFQPIQPQQVIMETFLGEPTVWHGDYTAYPLFINEAAYQKNHQAMLIAKKITIKTQDY